MTLFDFPLNLEFPYNFLVFTLNKSSVARSISRRLYYVWDKFEDWHQLDWAIFVLGLVLGVFFTLYLQWKLCRIAWSFSRIFAWTFTLQMLTKMDALYNRFVTSPRVHHLVDQVDYMLAYFNHMKELGQMIIWDTRLYVWDERRERVRRQQGEGPRAFLWCLAVGRRAEGTANEWEGLHPVDEMLQPARRNRERAQARNDAEEQEAKQAADAQDAGQYGPSGPSADPLAQQQQQQQTPSPPQPPQAQNQSQGQASNPRKKKPKAAKKPVPQGPLRRSPRLNKQDP